MSIGNRSGLRSPQIKVVRNHNAERLTGFEGRERPVIRDLDSCVAPEGLAGDDFEDERNRGYFHSLSSFRARDAPHSSALDADAARRQSPTGNGGLTLSLAEGAIGVPEPGLSEDEVQRVISQRQNGCLEQKL
jgi:hypothetical protein